MPITWAASVCTFCTWSKYHSNITQDGEQNVWEILSQTFNWEMSNFQRAVDPKLQRNWFQSLCGHVESRASVPVSSCQSLAQGVRWGACTFHTRQISDVFKIFFWFWVMSNGILGGDTQPKYAIMLILVFHWNSLVWAETSNCFKYEYSAESCERVMGY